MNDKYKFSLGFLEKLKEELKMREDVLRPQISERLRDARALGDFSENSELDSARDEQSINEERIKELKDYIANAILEEEDASSNVGKVLTILFDETGEELEFKLVSSTHEANPMENKISKESPLGKAVWQAGVGSQVEVKIANGHNLLVTVKSIRKSTEA